MLYPGVTGSGNGALGRGGYPFSCITHYPVDLKHCY